jgi:hypothetical protein
MSRWNRSGDDFYDGRRDFERLGHPDYEVDRYAISGPDADYMEAYNRAKREAERLEEEEQERREEEARAERRRQEYWEMERLRDEEQYQEEFPDEEVA